MTLLGTKPVKLNLADLATKLNEAAEHRHIELSSYGYIMHVVERYGMHGVYQGMLGSKESIDSYVNEAFNYKNSMMNLIVNASNYAKSVFSNVTDPDLCTRRLEEMSYPYVLYVLFRGLGQTLLAEPYKEAAEDHFRRYPATAELLPDKFKNVAEEFLSHESAE